MTAVDWASHALLANPRFYKIIIPTSQRKAVNIK
jgi:hypothetical protein